jgi:DNA-directed RNA polymerase subunit RPC12/RpoP
MADILFKCSGCATHLASDADNVGEVVNCTDCGQKVVVPQPGVSFSCKKCQTEFVAPPSAADENYNCPNCDTALIVPKPQLILFACSGCSQHLVVEADSVGEVIECSACRQKVLIPEAGTSFSCPNCQAGLFAPVGLVGAVFHCPYCETELKIPKSIIKPPSLPKRKPPPPKIAPRPQQSGRRCPYCRSIIAPAAIICVNCGVNLHTGRRGGESRQEPPPSDKTGVYVVVTLLIIAVVGGWLYLLISGMNPSERAKAAYEAITTKSDKTATEAQGAQPKKSLSTNLKVDVEVRAFTFGGLRYPGHSITFELLVNGEKVRTLESTSVSQTFESVPVEWGDRITGRALWRNGYGSVEMVNQSYAIDHYLSCAYATTNGAYRIQLYDSASSGRGLE